MRWDSRTYDLRQLNRTRRPLWNERRSVRLSAYAGLWIVTVLLSLLVF